MRLLVKVENFESIVDPDDVQRVRKLVGRKAEEIHGSGKVIESGVLADTRGAFFLVDVDSAAELSELFFPMHDVARMETHPVYSFDELEELFSEPDEDGATV